MDTLVIAELCMLAVMVEQKSLWSKRAENKKGDKL